MIEIIQNSFTIPPILLVLCYALGLSSFVGLGQWCQHVVCGDYEDKGVYAFVWPWLLRAALVVLMLPLFLSLGFGGAHGYDFSIDLELYLLCGVFLIYVLFQFKWERLPFKQIIENSVFELIKLVQFAVGASIIFALSVFIGMGIFLASAELQKITGAFDPMRDATMVVSSLWLAPYIFWYSAIKKKEAAGTIKTPKYFKFYKILGPILLGLFLFMIPLMIEKYLTSDKFKELRDRKPPLERV